MERYIEMKSKQSEDETVQLAREKECSQAADYSIKHNGYYQGREGKGFVVEWKPTAGWRNAPA